MKKIFLWCVCCLLLAYLIYSRYVVQFVWVNPNVNTSVFLFISKSIKELDKALNHATLAVNSENKNIKIVYQNAYGSGFLKHNPIPNDLDYAVGIHLGEYVYNGKNSEDIATSILEKITLFQAEFYNYINTIETGNFYSNYDVLSSLQKSYSQRDENIQSISKSIPKLFKHQNYVIYTNKTIYDDDNETSITFPFIMKSNEILVENYNPITLFTRKVKYYKTDRDFLRELTIVSDFYVDIIYGNDVVHAEIVPEFFTGQRFQLNRRFFVPIAFVGNASTNFLKQYNLLTNDEDYIEYRLFNFKRHLQEFSNLKELQDRPIKLFKRVLQCTDLILPILDKTTANEIILTIERNLNNPKIKLINDYQTALGNLIQISGMSKLYLNAQLDNKITEHTDALKLIAKEMQLRGDFNNIDKIITYTNNISEQIKKINSPAKLMEFNKETLKITEEITQILNNEVKDTIEDYDTILSYIDNFYGIMETAGFHKANLIWLNKNLIGVVKDDFTSQLSENELKLMAKTNNLADVDYKFTNTTTGPTVRYSVWVRYNPTKEENEAFNIMKSQLLNDKKNFDIKRKFIIGASVLQK